jgi:hypothetical protein
MKKKPSFAVTARATIGALFLIIGIGLVCMIPLVSTHAQNPASGTVGPSPGGPSATWHGTATAPLTLNAKSSAKSPKSEKSKETYVAQPVAVLTTAVGLVFYVPLTPISQILLDGPHPPEPAEPPQPLVLKKLKAQIKPRSVPAISKPAPAGIVSPRAPAAASWTALGPAPIPNGQTEPADANGISLTQAPVSGRTTAIVIDPSDANVAYVGTAQGGLYRTLDGGSTWTPLLDNALSLAVGSVVFDPADSTFNTLLVGTGESNFSGDSFAGVGVYEIANGKSANPQLIGPFNHDTTTPTPNDIMTHRGIPGLAIDPNNHNIVYVGTATGQQGIGPQPPTPGSAPNRGLYRSTDFFSGPTTFSKIPMLGPLEPANHDYRVTSIVYEPGSSDRMFVGIADASGSNDPTYFGGIWYTANASAATPTFTRIFETNPGTPGANGTASPFSPIKLAARKIGNIVTVVAITAEPAPTDAGRAYKASYNSTSPPASPTFTEMPGAQGFGGGQASYDIGVDIDATNANNIYISGTLSSAGDPRGTFLYSHDGGNTFNTSTDSLHVDGHMAGVAPSNPNVTYTGTDGGIWRSTNATSNGLTWTDINTAGYSATQFQSIALHPLDRNFSIGGTQDNGTEFLMPTGKWKRADFGDGGYALIDQTATNSENVTMYHTYYNAATVLIGFSRVKKASCATEGQWAFRGAAVGVLPGGGLPIILPMVGSTVCDGSNGQAANGISLADDVNFYAPMALGPTVVGSTGQTLYFGTDKLYRSIDQGDNMAVASQVLRPPTPPATANIPISAIGISPQNDNVRVVGTNDGHVFLTLVGAPTLVDVTDANMPGKYIGRVAIDPNNQNTAYVVFNGNAIQGKHVWKGNLSVPATAMWTAIDGNSLPDISVNALVVDPLNSQHIYIGTDRGVYFYDASAATPSWQLYGTGLPNVAVFDIAIQSDFRILRCATHGRGFYEIGTVIPPAPSSAVSRKTHGSITTPPFFDVPLPLAGAPGVECRSGGAGNNHQMVITFPFAVTFSSAAVTTGTGNVSSSSGSGTTTVTVNLGGVSNAQTITVTLFGVVNASTGKSFGNVGVQMSVLLGDVNANGIVSNTDVAEVKAQVTAPVDSSNFRDDVNANGIISNTDVALTKAQVGTTLP